MDPGKTGIGIDWLISNGGAGFCLQNNMRLLIETETLSLFVCIAFSNYLCNRWTPFWTSDRNFTEEVYVYSTKNLRGRTAAKLWEQFENLINENKLPNGFLYLKLSHKKTLFVP